MIHILTHLHNFFAVIFLPQSTTTNIWATSYHFTVYNRIIAQVLLFL